MAANSRRGESSRTHGSSQCATGRERSSSSAAPSPSTHSVRRGWKAWAKAPRPGRAAGAGAKFLHTNTRQVRHHLPKGRKSCALGRPAQHFAPFPLRLPQYRPRELRTPKAPGVVNALFFVLLPATAASRSLRLCHSTAPKTASPHNGPYEPPHEILVVLLAEEDLASLDPPRYHVVQRTGRVESGLSEHARRTSPCPPGSQRSSARASPLRFPASAKDIELLRDQGPRPLSRSRFLVSIRRAFTSMSLGQTSVHFPWPWQPQMPSASSSRPIRSVSAPSRVSKR